MLYLALFRVSTLRRPHRTQITASAPMLKNLVIAALLIAVAWLSVTVVRLENFHYATVVGMCSEYKADNPLQTVPRHNCLHSTETRTSFIWHIFYALKGE